MRVWDRVIDEAIMSALALVMGGLRLTHFLAVRLDAAFRPARVQDSAAATPGMI